MSSLQIDASKEEDSLSPDVCENERVSGYGRSGRLNSSPTACERIEGMQVTELTIVTAASIHKDLVLVHCQSKTVPCLWQIALIPLLPFTCLKTVGVH